MKRALLAAILALLPAALPAPTRAADPPGADTQADPFAGPPDSPPAEPDEDSLLRGTTPTNPPPPAPPPSPRAAPRASRRVSQVSDGGRATTPVATATEDQSGVALELSTSGFASGSLAGGIFLGGRTAGGLILGGVFDYGLQSTAVSVGGSSATTSTQVFRLGAGARQPFVRSADRRVDLYGAADVTFEYRSADASPVGGTSPTTTVSAAGFSLALGPGLRLWVHDQIAVGYVARFRLTYLSGDSGAIAVITSDAQNSASTTTIGFDGTFQILGVF